MTDPTSDKFAGLPETRRKGLEKMELLRKGSRLSVTPVSAEEWRVVCALAGVNDAVA